MPTYVRTPLPPTGFRAVDDLLTAEGSAAPSQPGAYDQYIRPALRGIHSAMESARPQTEAEHLASVMPLGAAQAGVTRAMEGGVGALYHLAKLNALKAGKQALGNYVLGVGRNVYDKQFGEGPAPAAPEAPGMFKPQYTFPRAQK